MFGFFIGQRRWSSCKWKSEFESCDWRFGIQEAPLDGIKFEGPGNGGWLAIGMARDGMWMWI